MDTFEFNHTSFSISTASKRLIKTYHNIIAFIDLRLMNGFIVICLLFRELTFKL